jgi:hypothetical protein
MRDLDDGESITQPGDLASESSVAPSSSRPDDDHDCLTWNSGGVCYVCRRPLSVEEQQRGETTYLNPDETIAQCLAHWLAALRAARGAKGYECFCKVATGRATRHTRACLKAQAALAGTVIGLEDGDEVGSDDARSST